MIPNLIHLGVVIPFSYSICDFLAFDMMGDFLFYSQYFDYNLTRLWVLPKSLILEGSIPIQVCHTGPGVLLWAVVWMTIFKAFTIILVCLIFYFFWCPLSSHQSILVPQGRGRESFLRLSHLVPLGDRKESPGHRNKDHFLGQAFVRISPLPGTLATECLSVGKGSLMPRREGESFSLATDCQWLQINSPLLEPPDLLSVVGRALV